MEVASITEADIRAVLRSCQSKFSLMRHQIESYDNFMTRVLPAIVRENSILVANYPQIENEPPKRLEFIFKNISIQSPTIKEANGFVKSTTPSMSRDRGVTYASSVFVEIEQRTLELPKDPSELPKLTDRKTYTDMLLCRLPVMVGSSLCYLHQTGDMRAECPHDEGGYFIINGMEKTVISQKKLRTNFPYVFPARKSASPIAAGLGHSLLTCEVRSSHESKLRSTSTLQLHVIEGKHGAPPQIVAVLPYLECPIPLAWLMHLLGWDPIHGGGKEIERLILGSVSEGTNTAAMSVLVRAIAQCVEMEGRQYTRLKVLEMVGKKGTHEQDKEKQARYVKYICCSETLPHMGVDDSDSTRFGKRIFLGHMISKLLGVLLDLTKHDDRDHYANKRVDTTGPLMSHLFRQLYRSFLKSLQSQIQKAVNIGKFVDLIDARFINHKRISGGFKMAFNTGNWGTPKIAGGAGSAIGQVGITQQLSQMTGISATAHGRRLNTPLHKEGRNPRPRQLPNSAWGVVCPTETPEGISCGLVTNLAWGARVRVGTPASVLIPVVMKVTNSSGELVVPISSPEHLAFSREKVVMVTVNGVVVGHCRCHSDANELVQVLKMYRQSQSIPFDTTIAYVRDPWQNVIRVHGDAGCLLRPVFNVEKFGELKNILSRFKGCPYAYTTMWGIMVHKGCIEYIDKDEESTIRIAPSITDLIAGSESMKIAEKQGQLFTHCELHPSTIHGVCASLIPFSNHNQSPRNTYQSAMGKQAMGIPATNYHRKLDTMMHVLVSPEVPLVSTWMDDMTNSRSLPAGQNVMVAIMCHSGFNQEDSLIMCQSSIEAGLFHSMTYRTCKEETRPNGTDLEKIEVPDTESCILLKAASYDHLDPETGVAAVGSRLKSGDIVIGKTVTTTDNIPHHRGGGKVKVVRDKSLQIRQSEQGEVDRVVISSNKEGQRNVYVRTRQLRIPHIGDKFCYTDDHQILTKKGWIPVKDLSTGDLVCSLDTSTGECRYSPVQETCCFSLSNENMCITEGDGISAFTTTNHRMVTVEGDSINIQEAGDLVGPYHKFVRGSDGLEPETLSESTEALYFLAGMWKAHMHCPTGELEFSVPSFHKNKVEEACKLLGVEVSPKKHTRIVRHSPSRTTPPKRRTVVPPPGPPPPPVQLPRGNYLPCTWDSGSPGDSVFTRYKSTGPEAGGAALSEADMTAVKDTLSDFYETTDSDEDYPSVEKNTSILQERTLDDYIYINDIVATEFGERIQRYHAEDNIVYSPRGSDTETVEITESTDRLVIRGYELVSGMFSPDPFWFSDLGSLGSRKFLEGAMSYTCSNILTAFDDKTKESFEIAAVHSGWSSVSRKTPEGVWEIHVSKDPTTRGKVRLMEGFTGQVYCATVDTGVMCVRRNDKVYWCGNSSRHGQKGIIGMTRRKADMPFSPEGLTPDIIVNPHAIPSRMTIGHLFETLLGSESCKEGKLGDGTPFRDLSVEQIADRLEDRGFSRYCDTTLFCGLTGKEMKVKVYFGPTYYQRLKHMVDDKIHARSRGPVAPLTRQPVEGRSREGGLRIGEMERDAIISHGASANIRESLFERSDPYIAHVCKKCGLLADSPCMENEDNTEGWCQNCLTGEEVTEVPMPFACKLTLQEISALHISPRLEFEESRKLDNSMNNVNQGVKMVIS